MFSLTLVELSIQRPHSFFTNHIQPRSCRIHPKNRAPTGEWECHPTRVGLWVAFHGTALKFSQKTECVYFWVKHFSFKPSSKHQWFHSMFRFESSKMTVSLSIPKHAVEFNRWFLKMNIKIGRLFSFFHFTPIALSGFCFTFRDLSKAQTCYVAFNLLGTTRNQFFYPKSNYGTFALSQWNSNCFPHVFFYCVTFCDRNFSFPSFPSVICEPTLNLWKSMPSFLFWWKLLETHWSLVVFCCVAPWRIVAVSDVFSFLVLNTLFDVTPICSTAPSRVSLRYRYCRIVMLKRSKHVWTKLRKRFFPTFKNAFLLSIYENFEACCFEIFQDILLLISNKSLESSGFEDTRDALWLTLWQKLEIGGLIDEVLRKRERASFFEMNFLEAVPSKIVALQQKKYLHDCFVVEDSALKDCCL